MATLASKRLVGGSRRRTATPVRVIDAVFHLLLELFEEKRTLEPHLQDGPIQTLDPKTCTVIVLLDVVDAPSKLNTLAVVGGLDGWREVFVRERSACCGQVSFTAGGKYKVPRLCWLPCPWLCDGTGLLSTAVVVVCNCVGLLSTLAAVGGAGPNLRSIVVTAANEEPCLLSLVVAVVQAGTGLVSNYAAVEDVVMERR